MAIDTNNEKLALISLLAPFNAPVPISADGLDQADNQHLLAGYPGILWSGGALVRAFGECELTVEAIFSGTVSNEMKLAATDTVEPIFDSEFSINE